MHTGQSLFNPKIGRGPKENPRIRINEKEVF